MVVTGMMSQMMSQAHIFTKRLQLLLEADPTVNLRSPQADTKLGAGDLQRTRGHAENVCDLVSIFSPLDEICYLPEPFRRKLCWLTTSSQGRASFALSCLVLGHV